MSAKMKEREKGNEFSWVTEKERKNDKKKLRVLGRYLGKVRVSHNIKCVAHVALFNLDLVAHSRLHIIGVIS